MERILFILLVVLLLPKCNVSEPPTPVPNYEIIDKFPDWDYNSDLIAYYHFNSNPDDLSYPTGLYTVDTTGNNKHLLILGKAFNPKWSLNGEKIAYTNGNLFILELKKMKTIQLTNNGADFFPNWFPSGDKLSFDRSGTANIVGTWIFDLKNNHETRFGSFSFLNWSSKGDKFIFSGKGDNDISDSQIIEADSSGNKTKTITSNNFQYNRYPKYSPNNNKIVWEISMPKDFTQEVWIMNSDGSIPKKITEGSSPSWGPYSKRIVYSKKVNNKILLFTINIQTNEIKQITN